MRILATGATGFVGQGLVRTLAEVGHEVWVLSRSPESARARLPSVAAAFPWDGLDATFPQDALEGVDVVLHLAGEPVAGRWSSRKRRAIRDSRVLGTSHLVRALAERSHRPARLVSASAIGYYGDRGDEELTEASAPGTGFLAEVCQGWEAAAREAEPLGVEVTCVRIGIVLGPEGGALAQLLPLFRKGLGGRLGSGRQWWSWIHRDDLISLLVWAASTPDAPPPVMNAVSPDPRPQAAFARALASALGKKLFLPAPAFALRLALGGFSEELLTSKRCLPRAAQAAGAALGHPSLEEALSSLLPQSQPLRG